MAMVYRVERVTSVLPEILAPEGSTEYTLDSPRLAVLGIKTGSHMLYLQYEGYSTMTAQYI